MFLCNGELYACGLPQYGQLGNGSDLQFNTSDSSIKMAFSPQPLAKKVMKRLQEWRSGGREIGMTRTRKINDEPSDSACRVWEGMRFALGQSMFVR